MARVLVTGASGFLGRELVGQLVSAAAEVHGVGRGEAPARWPGSAWHRVDLVDGEKVRSLLADVAPERIFHVAGAAQGTLKQLVETNVVTTENVLDAARRVPVLVAGSSAEVGAGPADRQPISEDEPLRPLTEYGEAKARQYRLVEGRLDEQPIAYARTFNLVGPDLPRTLAPAAFAAQVAEAEVGRRPPVLETGYLGNSRDYVDVRDAARAYRLLLESGATGVYNVCSGVATPVRRLVDLLVAESRVPLEVRELGQASGSDVSTQVGDRARIGGATGWSPEIPIERSLRDLLDRLRQTL